MKVYLVGTTHYGTIRAKPVVRYVVDNFIRSQIEMKRISMMTDNHGRELPDGKRMFFQEA